MKQRPILFSTEMVKAILEGRKTQTRRIVMPMRGYQSGWLTPHMITTSPKLSMCRSHEGDGYGDLGAQMEHLLGGPLGWVKFPYGKVGDILWVRESWRFAGGGFVGKPDTSVMSPKDFVYRADEEWSGPFKPSIHMPKAACRIFLEITDIRVERLQEISEGDAIAEGCEALKGAFWKQPNGEFRAYNVIDSYELLWNRINGEESWNENPWVWVITFKSVKDRDKSIIGTEK